MSRNSIPAKPVDVQSVGEPVLRPISARASAGARRRRDSTNERDESDGGFRLQMSLAGAINQQQEDVIDYLREEVRVLKD